MMSVTCRCWSSYSSQIKLSCLTMRHAEKSTQATVTAMSVSTEHGTIAAPRRPADEAFRDGPSRQPVQSTSRGSEALEGGEDVQLLEAFAACVESYTLTRGREYAPLA